MIQRSIRFINLFLFLNLLFSHSLLARPKIVLLTSIDIQGALRQLSSSKEEEEEEEEEEKKEEKEKYKAYLNSYQLDLKQAFQSSFIDSSSDSDFALESYSLSDQNTLYRTLNDPEVVAVFWVSHGGFKGTKEIFSSGGIYSWQGFDLAPVFLGDYPQLKVLAVLSCMSTSNVSSHSEASSRLVISYDTKITAETRLKDAIAKAKVHLKTIQSNEAPAPLPNPDLETSLLVKAVRYCSSSSSSNNISGISSVSDRQSIQYQYPAARIELSSGKVVATLPACEVNQVVETEFHLTSSEDISKLIITLGKSYLPPELLQKFQIGEVSIKSVNLPSEQVWCPFQQSNGKPFGITSRIYYPQSF